ncbi:MAG: hypothetical protein H0Z39_10060 [Peptococcaceae bacterium]|nr:hypothetical protein [Peptococcaceae bacterium]
MPQKLKRVVIKEEFIALTGDFVKAVLLNQFIYWSERVQDFDKFISEEKARAEKGGISLDFEPTNGWFYKSAEELSQETMIGLSPATVRRRVSELVENGWLHERFNPERKWDRTKQYRVDLNKIHTDLLKLGYVLQGYKVDVASFFKIENTFSKMEDGNSEMKNAFFKMKNACDARDSSFFKMKNANSKMENAFSKMKKQYQRLHESCCCCGGNTHAREEEEEEEKNETPEATSPETTPGIENQQPQDEHDKPVPKESRLRPVIRQAVTTIEELCGTAPDSSFIAKLELYEDDAIINAVNVLTHYAERKTVENVTGFLLDALENGWSLDTILKCPPRRQKPRPPGKTSAKQYRNRELLNSLYL